MLNLSPRLQSIYDHLLPGEPVWDICCDHGLIGLHAYASGAHPQIYFVDQVPHIIDELERKWNLYAKPSATCETFFLRQSGESVRQTITGTVVVAGVGNITIQKMVKMWLEQGNLEASRLIFCPQNRVEVFKSSLEITFALDAKYRMYSEHDIYERNRARKLLIYHKI